MSKEVSEKEVFKSR